MEVDYIKQGNGLELIKSIPNESIDLILTDPPYNTGMKSCEQSLSSSCRLNHFFNDKYDKEKYKQLVYNSCKDFYRVLKNNRACYIFINWKSLSVWLEALNHFGFSVKNVIVWDKKIHGLNYNNYAYRYELIIYSTKGQVQLQHKSVKDQQKRFYTDVWEFKREIFKHHAVHATVKPLALLEIIIRHATKKNDIVLDIFAGTGTTLRAAKKLERHYIGFELIDNYVVYAKQELNKLDTIKILRDYI